MAVNGVQGTNQSQAAAQTKANSTKLGDGLGKDSFLQLLITQMRYQDPLSPAKDTEYIAQLAQFNALEQMQNLNDKFDKILKWSQMSQASSLIGKQIEGIIPQGTDTDNDGMPDATKVSGTVQEVKFVDSEPKLIVGDYELSLSDVIRVSEAAASQVASSTAQDSEESTEA